MSAERATEEVAARRVHVPLGDRAYDILVGRGLLGGAGDRVRALGARAAAIVTDATVADLHAEPLRAALEAAGLRTATVSVRPGEASKSFSTLEQVGEELIAAKVERGDLVVALGGGVIGDLAGFAAAIVRRGMRFVQVPTTLLAQVDSSVGGKTGINSRQGKNLLGAFHQPSLVLADTATLDTLPDREFRAGFAEVLKYGLIADPAFFDRCVSAWEPIRAGGLERDEAVAESCRKKAAVVVADEREEGERALLNLGHTFGHALEALVGYDGSRLVHGEGVAIGMAQAFRFSARLGLCAPPEADRVERSLRSVGLPTRLADIPGVIGRNEAPVAETLLAAMHQDKKVKAGRLTFILARGIGRSFIAPGIEPADVLAFLRDEVSRA